MPEFRFNEADHTYWLGERRLYGVTDVIKSCGLMKGEDFFTDYARDRGAAVHAALELLAWDNLDWSSVDDRIKPYVESGALFFDHTKLKPKRTEFQAYLADLGVAGTWDWDNGDLLIDYKSGSPDAWHRVQTAVYQELANHNGIKIKRRASLYLQADGSIAKIKEHSDRSDLKIFLSCLNLVKWKDAA